VTKRSRHRLAVFLFASAVLTFSVVFKYSHPSQASSAGPSPVISQDRQPSGDFVPGDILVRFKKGSTLAQTSHRKPTKLTLLSYNGEISCEIARFEGSELVDGLRIAHVPAEETLPAIALLNKRSDVEYAEPNYIWHLAATPNDDLYPQQWSLKNTGQVGNNDVGCPDTSSCQQAGTVGEDIDAELAWNTTQGSSNVVVAVLDGGIDVNHPDLMPNIWHNPGETPDDGVDNDLNTFVDDYNGWDFVHKDKTVFDGEAGDDHATHVAGIIGARGNNVKGIAGVNWQVQIMSVKVAGADGAKVADIVSGLTYVRLLKQSGINVRITNNSYGGPEFSNSVFNAIQAMNGAGILFVTDAGNSARDTFSYPQYPADYGLDNIISVAATDRFGQLAVFSNYGARTVHIGAPGREILSTVPDFFNGPGTIVNNLAKYAPLDGTSMAAAAVSGGAALALAARPGATLQQLRNTLLYSGETTAALNGKTRIGKRLNLASVISTISENDTTAPAPATNLQIIASNGRNITLQWTAPGDDGNTGTAADYDFLFTSGASARQWFLPATAIPAAAGTVQTTVLQLPYRGAAGTLQLQTIDNAGNSSSATLSVNVPNNGSIDPYVQTLSPAAALTTGGTPLGIVGDNTFKENVALPFAFPYFGTNRTTVTVSSNGSLFFSKIPQTTVAGAPPQLVGLDSASSTQGLNRLAQIAGLWDHLRTDRGGNVFMVTDSTRVVFRWQAVTFGDGTPANEFPVNFEIELRRDGTIVMRYGAGQSAPINTNVGPVVGISAGEPDAYIEDSHTSEFGPIDLTNAQTITFTPAIFQFSAANYNVSEAVSNVTVTVTRSGNTSVPASVSYSTADTDDFTVGCSDTVNNQHSAYARCDFATSVDTLTFGAGETSKTFTVPIINDSLAEGDETFSVVLSSPVGATLGTPATATVTINDNETVTGPNPIFTTPFFVRQHYLDFLSREPEVGEPWTAVLNNCSDVNNNPACDRVTVSGAFFGSPEFQLKGYFVYRFYKLAFNRLPLYTEIVVDMRAVTGQTPAEVFQKKGNFTNAFVQRSEFTQIYDGLSNAAYVSMLMGRYNLTQITTPDPANPDGANKVTLSNMDLTNRLNGVGGTLTRAQVLRAIADSDQVFTLEFNQAFVAMQYYGYLRRTPEPTGYNAWLTFLNANPNDSRTMVNGFMNSAEYRLRFGPNP
jgi:subtilisin family serine protease